MGGAESKHNRSGAASKKKLVKDSHRVKIVSVANATTNDNINECDYQEGPRESLRSKLLSSIKHGIMHMTRQSTVLVVITKVVPLMLCPTAAMLSNLIVAMKHQNLVVALKQQYVVVLIRAQWLVLHVACAAQLCQLFPLAEP